MKSGNYTVLARALLTLGMTATQIRAQPTYTLYTFTNFAGTPGGPGNVDGIGSAARFHLQSFRSAGDPRNPNPPSGNYP
jgi:hypothetical protein